jgi:hypothetical protein
VYGTRHALTEKSLFVLPSWNLYCLSLDLAASLVSFSINGVASGTALSVPNLSTPASVILNSRITVSNEMFTWVNVYSLPLATAVSTNPGNELAWAASDWTYSSSLGGGGIMFLKTKMISVLKFSIYIL